jgi:hypothetical protein
MVLEPYARVLDSGEPGTGIPCPAVRTVATIEDTLELYVQESETAAAAPVKVNKWHEKFARGRKGSETNSAK